MEALEEYGFPTQRPGRLGRLLREIAERYTASWDPEYEQLMVEAIEDYSSLLLWVAYQFLPNRDLAFDAVQEGIVKACVCLPTYSAERVATLAIRQWLCQIVRYTAIDMQRKERRQLSLEQVAVVGSGMATWLDRQAGSRFEQPETSIIREELLQIMQEVIWMLSPSQRMIVILYF